MRTPMGKKIIFAILIAVLFFGGMGFGAVAPPKNAVSASSNFFESYFSFHISRAYAEGTMTKALSDSDCAQLQAISGDAFLNCNTLKEGGGILYAATWVAAKILEGLAALIVFALNVGTNIINLPVVKTGFDVVLGITNLGFVLAIIIIAFATIFRFESYAMKQTLWRLIVAALLVNFSFFIAGAFISVANIFTKYFLDTFNNDLANSLATALNPQALAQNTQSPGVLDFILDIGFVLKYIGSLFFVLIFTLLIIITFAAIFIMLLIRAIYLAILLILMPIVWLLWIFPGSRSQWQKWWGEFLRWTFFAPIMLFFIFLVKKSTDGITRMKEIAEVKKLPQAIAFQKSLSIADGFIGYVAQLVIFVGLLMGGLIAANKLSITGAKTAYGAAQGAVKGMGGWVGKTGVRLGTGWLSKPRGEPGQEKSYNQRMSEWSAKHPTASRLLGAGFAIRGVSRLSAVGGENQARQAKSEAIRRSVNENVAMLGSANAAVRQGILAHLQEKDLLDKVPNLEKYISKGYKAEAARFGQAPTYSKIEKAFGMNAEMKEALNAGKMDQFFDEGRKFFAKFSPKDFNLPMYNEIFQSKSTGGLDLRAHLARQTAFAYGVGLNNPGDIKKILVNLEPRNFDQGVRAINVAQSEIYSRQPGRGDIAEKIRENLTNIQNKRMMGEFYDYTPPAATPTTAPAAPPPPAAPPASP